jgi:hypothetical protein
MQITYSRSEDSNWQLSSLQTDLGRSTNVLNNSKRVCAVNTAMREVGKTDFRKYYAGTIDDPANTGALDWCGIFTLWVFHQCKMLTIYKWEIGKGYLYNLPTTRSPVPGDVVYLERNNHHAILYDIVGATVTTIDGNSTNGSVAINRRSIADIAAFYRALSYT